MIATDVTVGTAEIVDSVDAQVNSIQRVNVQIFAGGF